MKKTSLMAVAAMCAALLAAPAFAQGTQGSPMTGMSADMKMKSTPKHKAAKPMHMAGKSHHKMSCYDYAWESADMKDCLAKHPDAKPM